MIFKQALEFRSREKWPLTQGKGKNQAQRMKSTMYNLFPVILPIKYQYIRDICAGIFVAALFIMRKQKGDKGKQRMTFNKKIIE